LLLSNIPLFDVWREGWLRGAGVTLEPVEQEAPPASARRAAVRLGTGLGRRHPELDGLCSSKPVRLTLVFLSARGRRFYHSIEPYAGQAGRSTPTRKDGKAHNAPST